jgi:neutral ceramidase
MGTPGLAPPLFAGVAEATITPPVGIPLVGPQMPSTGVHDDLFARALVLDDGAQRVALVCLDLIGLDFSLADRLRAAIAQRIGAAMTLLNCSHTHSAPFTVPWSYQGWADFQCNWGGWREDVVRAVTAAAGRAAEDLREASLRAGRAPAQVGLNRRLPQEGGVIMRPNPEGLVAPWVDVLRVDGADGAPIAVVLSHAAHPVIVHATSTLIGADFPAYATAEVRRHFGGGAIAMFAQGCCGNINADPLRGGLEAAVQAGTALGNAAVQAALESRPVEASALRIASRQVWLPLQDWPALEHWERALAEAEALLAEAQRNPDLTERELFGFRDLPLCLRDMRAKMDLGPAQPLRFEVHALAAGQEWCLVAMPHEVFAEYQLWTDEASPFPHTMVWAYTNGCESYVPTDEALALGPAGGYEAGCFPFRGAGLMYHHRLALRPGIERQVRDAVRGVCDDLR